MKKDDKMDLDRQMEGLANLVQLKSLEPIMRKDICTQIQVDLITYVKCLLTLTPVYLSNVALYGSFTLAKLDKQKHQWQQHMSHYCACLGHLGYCNHRHLSIIDCLSFVMSPLLAPLVIVFSFLLRSFTVLMKQTRQAVHVIKQSIFHLSISMTATQINMFLLAKVSKEVAISWVIFIDI